MGGVVPRREVAGAPGRVRPPTRPGGAGPRRNGWARGRSGVGRPRAVALAAALASVVAACGERAGSSAVEGGPPADGVVVGTAAPAGVAAGGPTGPAGVAAGGAWENRAAGAPAGARGGADVAGAVPVPAEIHYDLTAYDWYRRGEPLTHDGRAYRPVGPPVPTPETGLTLLGRYGGVSYYAPEGADGAPDTLYVPVFEGYWLRFVGGGAPR